MRNAVLATTLSCLFGAAAAAEQTPAPAGAPARAAVSAAVTAPPTVDGRLDEATWAGGQLVSGFTQREPTEGQPVSERTEVRILHDEEALYIGAWLYDSDPAGIVVGRTLRDAS